MLTRRQMAILAAAALLIAGIALFFLAGGAVWLKVLSGVMVGAGATRLIMLARPSARAPADTFG